jgi:drug/metabolite transporter (DMT)-like permease
MSTRRIDITLLAVAAVWGSSYLAAKEVATPDTVFAFLAVRFTIAAVVLAVLLGRRMRGICRAELWSGMLFGAVLAAICSCETYGVTSTSASNAGLIVALTIVITPLLQRFAGGGRVPPTFYGAGAVAVLGCVLLTQSGGFSPPGLGDTLVAVAALLRAVHVTVIARVSTGRQLDSARTTFVQFVAVAVTSAGLAQMFGTPATTFTAAMSPADWALTGYLALACTVFAFVVQMWAVRRTSPARVSLLLGTEPLWAVLVGVGLGGDPVTGIGLLGAALVLAGTNWGRSTLGLLHLEVGVAAREAHGHVGDQRVEEPLPINRVDACAHGEVQAG